MKSSLPIGIFDSGVGGLTVAKAIKNLLPNESIIYFGDTAHLPYGDKSKETIVGFVKKITRFLLEKNCKAIIVACNTASANAYEEMLKIVNGRCVSFNVIEPVAEKVSYELVQKVGVIATKSTVNSGVYKKLIRKKNRHIQVIEKATPLLVPIIEEGFIQHPLSQTAIQTYLSDTKLKDIDALILGCTHYPLIIKEIEDFYKGKVRLLDSPLIVANHVYHQLDKMGLLEKSNHHPSYEFFLSDITPNFVKVAKKIFGKEITFHLQKL